MKKRNYITPEIEIDCLEGLNGVMVTEVSQDENETEIDQPNSEEE